MIAQSFLTVKNPLFSPIKEQIPTRLSDEPLQNKDDVFLHISEKMTIFLAKLLTFLIGFCRLKRNYC